MALLAGIHYYLWVRLVRDVGLPPGAKRALTWLLWGLAASVPAAMLMTRALARQWSEIWVRFAYVWMGTMFLLLVAVAAFDAMRGAALLFGKLTAPEPDLDRRQTLSRLVGLMAAVVGVGASAWALREGGRLRVKRVEISLARLPATMNGTSIVQLTDVHIGPTIGREFIEQMVRMVNDLAPDVVAITGDLVDGSVQALAEHAAPLAGLQSKYGTFFVTGNHEYYSGAHEWCDHLTSLGIRVLRNEHVCIGNDEHHFHLAGIDDYQAKGFGHGHGPDLEKALAGRDGTRALVLLAHQPKAVLQAREHNVGLQLSGHTHGGQLWPFNWLVKLQQPVVAGLERFGETLIYVSCGTGYWGPPMRLRAPAEITHITLRSA